MADDRIFLKCNICGDTLFLGKQFGFSAFYWRNYGLMNGDKNSPSLEDRLNKFYEDHYHPEAGMDKRWNGDYSIAYENELR